jgi:HK97 gp10 family phage protein
MAKNSANLKLTGFKELEAALLKLPPELAKTVEAAALRAGMVPVRKAAIGYAGKSKRTGLLQKSIGLTVRRIRRKMQYVNRYTARVGPRGGFRQPLLTPSGKQATRKGRPAFQDPRYYAHLVEYGTAKHPAQPFIRPALEAVQGEILAAMAKGYAKGMDRVVRKIRSKK